MNITENKYHSTIRLEFWGLISDIVNQSRSVFHVYTIHRLLSLGLLVDFTFQYLKSDNPDKCVLIELDLKEHGKALFKIDIEANYGKVADKHSMQVLKDFLANYNTKLDTIGQRGTKLFDK